MTQAIMTGQRDYNCYNRALYPSEEELSNVPRRIDYLNGRDRLQILPKLSLDGSISLPTSTLPTLRGISVSRQIYRDPFCFSTHLFSSRNLVW